MTTIRNLLSLAAAIPTLAPKPATPSVTPRACGEVNVFYTGFPPYHPLVQAQGWDPRRVDIGLKNETVEMVKAGYNVLAVWAGTEVPIGTVEQRMDEEGVDWDMTAIGFGMRGATLQPIVERFEDLVEMYDRKSPKSRKVFNHNPESMLWSVTHRMPMIEDCEAAGKPGKLLGYEEICDSRCNHEAAAKSGPHNSRDELPAGYLGCTNRNVCPGTAL